MQHNIAEQEEQAERRVKTIELTLVNHNETVDRVLAACRRIQRQWSNQSTSKEGSDEHE